MCVPDELSDEKPEPWSDPVIEEVRQIRRRMDAEVGGDVHAYFERLRKAQVEHGDRVVQEQTPKHSPPPSHRVLRLS